MSKRIPVRYNKTTKARFQQKQLQEKEQKLLQLYDQQQQRAHQVAQRGSAGSNTSNQGSTMNHQTMTKTTTTTRTTSTSQGGKVRQMFDERRQTTVKGIDRSYPLEPLDNKQKKQISGFTPAKSKNISKHTVTTVRRTARADVNSNINDGKPVVSYHEDFNRESFDNIHDDEEFVNENDVERYFNGNCQNRNESENGETMEINQMIGKINLMEFDKNSKHRVVNDLESEQFPEDLMLDVPDKVPKKSVAKKLSQSELRLERFKNANAKKNKTTNSSITRKRSDPLFPTQTTTRDSPPTKSRKKDQKISKTNSTLKKEQDSNLNSTRDEKVLNSEKKLDNFKFEENNIKNFDPKQENFHHTSRESDFFSNQNQSELKSIFLIQEVIQGQSWEKDKDFEFENEENQSLEIKELEDDIFKIEKIQNDFSTIENFDSEPSRIEEKENVTLKKEEKNKKSFSGRESPKKLISKSEISRKYSIERTPSPVVKKSKIESIHQDQENFQKKINLKISTFSHGVQEGEKKEIFEKTESLPELEKRKGTEKRKESIKPEKSSKRKESIRSKEAEKIEDEIFLDDHCFRNRTRRKIKDSIREKLNIDLEKAIKNKFTLPVKKSQKKKSQDESKNLKISQIFDSKDFEDEDKFIQRSINNSRDFSPEKIFENPADYQEIIIEDQTIDSRKNTPSPQIIIKSRRQSVENSETISSAAKRKPSLENRKSSIIERNYNRDKKIETENQIENKIITEIEIKIENRSKSLDLEKPLKSIELVRQANKTSKSQIIEEFPVEKIEHKIVKKQEAIFDNSDKFQDKKSFDKNSFDIEVKMIEMDIKRQDVGNKIKEVEAKNREFDSKISEVEDKRKELELKNKEVERKKKEVEEKIKEIEEKIFKKEIQPKRSSNQYEPNMFGNKKKIEIQKSKDEVDKVEKSNYKVVKEIEICREKSRNNLKSETQHEELKNKTLKKISKISPISKVGKKFSKSVSEKSSPIKIQITEKGNIKGFKRTDSVESALRRFDSIGTDPGSYTSKESLRNKSPDSTKLKDKNIQLKEEKSLKNSQIQKKSNCGTYSKKSTPKRPIATPINQRKSRRASEDEKNFDYSRISTARDSIELTRNFIRTRSPSCKRKLFQDSDIEMKNSSEFNSDEKNEKIFQDKIKVTKKGIDQMENKFLIEKQCHQESVKQFSKNNENVKGIYEVSVQREIKKEIQNQSSKQPRKSQVLVSGTFIKKGKNKGNFNEFLFRNLRSPSPNFGEREQNENSRPSTRRSVPPSPSKSPDNNLRRDSVELKNSDLRITRRPVVHSPKKGEFLDKEKISDFSKDVVDAPNFENSYDPLESDQLKTGSSTISKKCDAFVVNLDDSTEIKKATMKPILKSEKIITSQKQNSITNSVPRPSSSLSVSSGGSSKGKMSTKIRSAASRGSTSKSPRNLGSRADCNDSLVSCKICGRRFAPDRINLHEQICSKAGQKKRKQFDAMKFRLQGTDLEPYVKNSVKKQEPKSKKQSVKSNWRRTHEDFINAIRSAKQVQAHLAAGGKLSDLPPPPPSDNSDYVQCPHCGRKFNESAAERHIPKCETMRHNKPNPRAPPKPRR